jgi:hypothetical protein
MSYQSKDRTDACDRSGASSRHNQCTAARQVGEMPNASLFIPQELADVDPARYIGVWLIGGMVQRLNLPAIPTFLIIEHIWNTGGIVRAIACED